MKKILWVILGLLLLLAAAAGIFIVTFNADSYRPFFQQKLQEALKKPVLIKKITLGWNDGISLDVDGLTIFKDDKSPDALLHLKKASILVNAKPLLKREIQVSSVILESPEIDFINTSKLNGRIDLPSGSSSAFVPVNNSGTVVPQQSNVEAVPAEAMSFLVDEIKIHNGRIHYADPLSKSPVDISILDLDAVVRNISLTGPLDFDGKASLFSERQNISFEGKIRLQGAGALDIENLVTRVQLEAMDTAKILKSLPALQQVGLAQGLAGSLETSFKKIQIIDGAVRELDGEVHLTQARFKTGNMPVPFENGAGDADFNLDHVTLQRLTGNMGSGRFAASALTQNLKSSQPQTQAEISLTGLSLTDVAPPVSQTDPYLEGAASLNMRGAAVGAKDYEIKQSLSGNGQLNIQNPVLRNMNVLREIINKLSMIPGVSKGIQSRLPENYNQKLQARDTQFMPIEIPVTINQGVYFFDHAVIQAESFAVIASGKGDLLGNLQGEASLLIEPQLSRAMMAGVNELQYLADSKGQLQIPLTIQGVRGSFSITPNVSYVVSKLAASKTQEVLANLLTKKNGANQTGQTTNQSSPLSSLLGQNQNTQQQGSYYGQQTNQQQQSSGTQGLLGQLLTAALESKKNAGSSQQ